MAKARARSSTGERAGPTTRQRIVEAALDTLKSEGFAGASARAIARTGGFNQALVFYHFGTVNGLLLAALDETSSRRLARYRQAVGDVDDLPGLLRVAADVYREDLDAGHITVLAEMLAGSTTYPELRAPIAERVAPWVDFTREALERVLGASGVGALVPLEDVAFAIVALYLGVEVLTHLDGDRRRAESMFAAGDRIAALLGSLSGGVSTTGGRA
jgi:AcrR family transcriptional regulator